MIIKEDGVIVTKEEWGDKPIPEDDVIEAAHPVRSGRNDLYQEASRFVGAKRSKVALINLVTWLLVRIADRADDNKNLASECREHFQKWEAEHIRVLELETERSELHREIARLRKQLETARNDASEMEKKAIVEGNEALALKAELAALKASMTVMEELSELQA